jgi:hypothetical protein
MQMISSRPSQGNLRSITYVDRSDGDDDNLSRTQPEWPVSSTVLGEHTDESLDGTQEGSVDHDGSGSGTLDLVGSVVGEVESLGEVEVELQIVGVLIFSCSRQAIIVSAPSRLT